MKKHSLIIRLKEWIASIGWKLFIWGNSTTQEKYWEEIYEQEKAFKKEEEI
mgnify:CR=1 FL=1